MRIGCLQFAPQVGDVDNNLNRADAVLSRANPEELDLLVLPELAFSGYNFKSLEQIAPFLEPSGSGISSLWARTTALKYNCLVAVGYPEKVDPTQKWPTGPEYYNSVILVNGDGETAANYRKSFLYYTDETWALEGDGGFYEGYIPGLGHTSMGICMDLNPYKFEAPWHAFEFAFHVLEHSSNLVIVSMAWMTREDGRVFSRMPNEPDMDTLTYWVTRLEPLIRAEDDGEVIVIFCNRTGTEGEAIYAGTSAVVGIQHGEVRVYGLLGRGEKELLVVDTKDPPYAKLVYRPDADKTVLAHARLERTDSFQAANSHTSGASSGTTNRERQDDSPSYNSQHSSSKSVSPSFSDESGSEKRMKPSPKIQIPSRPAWSSQCSSANTVKSLGSDIPTPSAPSPTPQGARPRLVIPKSPTSWTWQVSSPQPMSTQSTHSVRSIQSIKSNQSIRSNERPPAESTPYPDSGLPLSGYPRSTHEKTIYGGQVIVSQIEQGWSPVTPFDVTSPAEGWFNWQQYESAVGMPTEPQGWPSEATSPVARHKKAFQHWPQIGTETNSWKRNSNARESAVQPGVQGKGNKSDIANAESPFSSSRNSPPPSDNKAWTNDLDDPSRRTDFHALPSYPEPCTARQLRSHDSLSFSLSHLDLAEEDDVPQDSNMSSRRPESSQGRHGDGIPDHFPERPSSPKSRNCSRSRPTEAAASFLLNSHPAAIGNHLVRPQTEVPFVEFQDIPRPDTRLEHRARSLSASQKGGARDRSWTPAGFGRFTFRSDSRGVSRGRFPGPSSSPARPAKRARTQSPFGDAIQSGVRRRGSDVHAASRVNDMTVFEATESVVCPNCPVHGRQSVETTENPGQVEQAELKESKEQDVSAPEDSAPRTASDSRSSSLSHEWGSFSPGPIATSESNSLAEFVTTASTASRLPPTPMFDPPTPKSMVFFAVQSDPSEQDEPFMSSPAMKQSPVANGTSKPIRVVGVSNAVIA